MTFFFCILLFSSFNHLFMGAVFALFAGYPRLFRCIQWMEYKK